MAIIHITTIISFMYIYIYHYRLFRRTPTLPEDLAPAEGYVEVFGGVFCRFVAAPGEDAVFVIGLDQRAVL